jgi:hypothetical protein
VAISGVTAAEAGFFAVGCRRTEPRRTWNPPDVEIRVLDDQECHRVPYGAPWTEKGEIVDCPPSMVHRDAAGRCWATPKVDCPPPEEATCNPPAPMPVRCPGTPRDAGIDAATPATTSTVPPQDAAAAGSASAAPNAADSFVIVRDKECVRLPFGGADANGTLIDCPLDKTTKRKDGTCTYVDFECPPDAKCNPPAPQVVRCPKGL